MCPDKSGLVSFDTSFRYGDNKEFDRYIFEDRDMDRKTHERLENMFKFVSKSFSSVTYPYRYSQAPKLAQFKYYLEDNNAKDILNIKKGPTRKTLLLHFSETSGGNIGGIDLLKKMGSDMEVCDVFGVSVFSYLAVSHYGQWNCVEMHLLLGWIDEVKNVNNLSEFYNKLISAFSFSSNLRKYNDQVLTLINRITGKGILVSRWHYMSLLDHSFTKHRGHFGFLSQRMIRCSDFLLLNRILNDMVDKIITLDFRMMDSYIEVVFNNNCYFDEYLIAKFVEKNIIPTKDQLDKLKSQGNVGYIHMKIREKRYDWVILRESILNSNSKNSEFKLPMLLTVNKDIFKHMICNYM